MWSTPGRRLPLAGQLLLLQLAVLAVVLAVVGAISVQQSTRAFEEERGSQLRSVAEYVATLPYVRAQLNGLRAGEESASDLARSLAPSVALGVALSNATDLMVVSPDGSVLAPTDPGRVGEPADLGDSDALEGSRWVGDVEPGGRRGEHARRVGVRDRDPAPVRERGRGPLEDALGELPRRTRGPEVVEVEDPVGEPVGRHAQQPRPETVREAQPGHRVGAAVLPGVGVGAGDP